MHAESEQWRSLHAACRLNCYQFLLRFRSCVPRLAGSPCYIRKLIVDHDYTLLHAYCIALNVRRKSLRHLLAVTVKPKLGSEGTVALAPHLHPRCPNLASSSDPQGMQWHEYVKVIEKLLVELAAKGATPAPT